jgi:hypothetical protein
VVAAKVSRIAGSSDDAITPSSGQYLLIQNKGEAPVEGYTVLGYSSTRNCGVGGVIGQFGSGTKFAINLCLRNALPVWVYCGKTRLEFSLEKEVVNDGLRDETVYHVIYRKNNNQYKRAGWVLDWGLLDWSDIGMGLREFISNAIDRTLREDGSLACAQLNNELSVKIVDDADRRAKAGFTRVYVALNDKVREYYGDLGKKFLHFSDDPESAKPGLIAKDIGPAQIYRNGVWVRELAYDSVYDYNFNTDEIKIDESRNSSDYAVRAACARKLQDAKASELAPILRAQLDAVDTVEANFDEDYLTGFGSLDSTQSAQWREAWEAAAGPGAVACDNTFSVDYTEKKGHNAGMVGSNWMKALKKVDGVNTAYDVLNVDEQRGRTTVPATSDAVCAVDWAWETFELAGLTGNRERPEVYCFQQISSAEAATNGYQNTEGVHIHIDIANDGQSNELRKTALEEVTHWITGATDNSRDFQNFLLDTIVNLA